MWLGPSLVALLLTGWWERGLVPLVAAWATTRWGGNLAEQQRCKAPFRNAGWNQYGQLGDGTTVDSDSPLMVQTDLLFSDITAGAWHTCGLRNDGSHACWGAAVGVRKHAWQVLFVQPKHVGSSPSWWHVAC